MRFVAVLPWVLPDYKDACVAAMSPRFRNDLMLVDNSEVNIGIMRAHNIAVDKVLEEKSDWLIIMSAAVRFGGKGGDDFLEHLEQHPEKDVIEAWGLYGWHLVAFSRRLLQIVGKWDESLSPYGFCDLDYSWRIQVAFSTIQTDASKPIWDKFPVDATDMGMGHAVKSGRVDAPAGPRLAYLCAKWGMEIEPDGGKTPPKYLHPFNDPTKPISWWPTPPDPRSILPA